MSAPSGTPRGTAQGTPRGTAQGTPRGTAHGTPRGTGNGTAHGTAHGAVTIINATATGVGCSLAIDAPTAARWAWHGDGWDWMGAVDDRLSRAVWQRMQQALPGHAHCGATASATSPFPPARGLKTSSGAATALVRAAAAAAGAALPPDEVDRLAVQAAKDAGVTITGAFDDQVAVSRGGCHLTDNRQQRILLQVPVDDWHVAVWVPEATIPKQQVARVDVGPARAAAQRAVEHLRQGDVPRAMQANGDAFLSLYAGAGLPVSRAPVEAAVAAGARAAGLSGTGPAVAALFDDAVDLPAVPGGTWRWHRVVPP